MTAFARPEVSDKVEKISSVKVNDLAAIVETKVAESAGDTTKPADVKYVPAEVRKRLKGTLVFEVAEEMPEFPGGGMSAFMDLYQDEYALSGICQRERYAGTGHCPVCGG